MEIELTSANFEEVALKADKPVLIDFWANWCPPCKMLAPIIAEISGERQDILVCKVNVDEEQALAVKYGVAVIPTLVVLKNGVEVARDAGYKPKAEVLSMLKGV